MKKINVILVFVALAITTVSYPQNKYEVVIPSNGGRIDWSASVLITK